jgi:endonuclease/exonuclease/phosphatase family metal-dependent hydrolase
VGQNSIGWRTADWELVEKHTYKIPYFHGHMVAQPYVLLRNRSTGSKVWVMNTHNPANSHGPAQQWRNRAIDIEADLANQLTQTGTPVLFTGDFNDRQEAFCPLASQTTLKAANGGWASDGTCRTPSDMRIDWIFMSRRLNPSNYWVIDSNRIHTITDHRVPYVDIAMPFS